MVKLKNAGLFFKTHRSFGSHIVWNHVDFFSDASFTPGSPLEMKLARDKSGGFGDKSALTEEALDQLKKQYNLDKPVLVR